MSKKKTKKIAAKIIKSHSANYTFLDKNYVQSNSTQPYEKKSDAEKEIEKRHHDSRNIKRNYKSKKIRTMQGHLPIYE